MISFFKKMYLLIFIASASMLTANAAEKIINHASAISPISSSDFTVQINNHPFALGATWNESAKMQGFNSARALRGKYLPAKVVTNITNIITIVTMFILLIYYGISRIVI